MFVILSASLWLKGLCRMPRSAPPAWVIPDNDDNNIDSNNDANNS